ncbi:hypothetical protein DHD80_19050 [Gramella sp. AN32]|nr:hypothetical protein [Gramella sp. AN32]
MSQNRRKRRQRKKNEKPVKSTVTKRDKLYGILALAGIFVAVLIIYFFETIFYFFYLLFYGN